MEDGTELNTIVGFESLSVERIQVLAILKQPLFRQRTRVQFFLRSNPNCFWREMLRRLSHNWRGTLRHFRIASASPSLPPCCKGRSYGNDEVPSTKT